MITMESPNLDNDVKPITVEMTVEDQAAIDEAKRAEEIANGTRYVMGAEDFKSGTGPDDLDDEAPAKQFELIPLGFDMVTKKTSNLVRLRLDQASFVQVEASLDQSYYPPVEITIDGQALEGTISTDGAHVDGFSKTNPFVLITLPDGYTLNDTFSLSRLNLKWEVPSEDEETEEDIVEN